MITATRRAFCAGGDVKGMGDGSNKAQLTFDERLADLRTKQRTLTGALAALGSPLLPRCPVWQRELECPLRSRATYG
ncbi:Enoyl-CoA hydratase (fragment) [Bradyrhizobium vignae]|uniref:Enoyl-CoA hydratase n=1 Tax=Bradyrhizobium vignae TaxID=1549949 RepID=A0A2U3PUN8_9BRAD